MMTRLTKTLVLGLCGLMLVTGCYNPPVERMYARRAIKAGDYDTAMMRAGGVLERDPSDWEAHYLMGQALMGKKQPVKAQSEFEMALAVQDENDYWTPKILDAIAESMRMQERYADLTAFLDAQIDRYEGWEDYARKARFLAKSKDMDGAALAYRQAAFFSRNETEDIYIEIADFYESLGNYDKSIQALKWAYYINDEHPDLPARFRSLGVVPGPTLKEAPPQPENAGDSIFNLPRLIGE